MFSSRPETRPAAYTHSSAGIREAAALPATSAPVDLHLCSRCRVAVRAPIAMIPPVRLALLVRHCIVRGLTLGAAKG